MGLFGNSAEKVLQKGTPAIGHITGIKVETRSTGDDGSSERSDTYAVETTSGQRFAIRQRLSPDDVVRLGMDVDLRVLEDDAVIDWAATMRRAGVVADTDVHRWKSGRGNEHLTGIDDQTLGMAKKARNGDAVEVEIVSIDDKAILMGLASKLTITLLVDGDDPYEATVDLGEVPHYAAHLASVGARLPAFVDRRRPDRVAIDWASAAEHDPGVGRPPSELVSTGFGKLFGRTEAASAAMSSGASAPLEAPPVAPAPVAAPPIDGVAFETYAEVQARLSKAGVDPEEWDRFAQGYGVPAGRWSDVSMQWSKQMVRSAELRAAMGSIQQRIYAE